MKILFSPAKTFKDGVVQSVNKTFKSETYSIINNIKSWNKEEYISNFKISKDIFDDVYNYYNNFDNNESFIASSVFNGQSFISLDYDSLGDFEKDYVNKNVYIIDALYGVIKFDDVIKKYRLDFHTKSIKLKEVWRDYYSSLFSDEVILSLASEEFTSLIKSDKVYRVSFVDIINNKKQKVSVFNKQMRGKLLRYIAINNINNVSGLPTIINGYKLNIDGFNIEYIKE